MLLFLCVSFVAIVYEFVCFFRYSEFASIVWVCAIRHVEIQTEVYLFLKSGDSCAFVLKVLTIWHSASTSNRLHCVEFTCISVGG